MIIIRNKYPINCEKYKYSQSVQKLTINCNYISEHTCYTVGSQIPTEKSKTLNLAYKLNFRVFFSSFLPYSCFLTQLLPPCLAADSAVLRCACVTLIAMIGLQWRVTRDEYSCPCKHLNIAISWVWSRLELSMLHKHTKLNGSSML